MGIVLICFSLLSMEMELDSNSLVRFRTLEIDMQRGGGVCINLLNPYLLVGQEASSQPAKERINESEPQTAGCPCCTEQSSANASRFESNLVGRKTACTHTVLDDSSYTSMISLGAKA